MKLIFTKNEDNEIDVKLQKGTIAEDFTYIEMIKQLLASNNFDDTEFKNLTNDEEARLKTMLDKITSVFKEDEENEPE